MPDINNGQKYLCIISVFQYMLHEIHVMSIISIQTHKPDNIISNICGGGGQADTSWVPVTVGMRQGTIVGTSETMAF